MKSPYVMTKPELIDATWSLIEKWPSGTRAAIEYIFEYISRSDLEELIFLMQDELNIPDEEDDDQA